MIDQVKKIVDTYNETKEKCDTLLDGVLKPLRDFQEEHNRIVDFENSNWNDKQSKVVGVTLGDAYIMIDFRDSYGYIETAYVDINEFSQWLSQGEKGIVEYRMDSRKKIMKDKIAVLEISIKDSQEKLDELRKEARDNGWNLL